MLCLSLFRKWINLFTVKESSPAIVWFEKTVCVCSLLSIGYGSTFSQVDHHSVDENILVVKLSFPHSCQSVDGSSTKLASAIHSYTFQACPCNVMDFPQNKLIVIGSCPHLSMIQYIAAPCLSAIWVLRQGTGLEPPIAGCKIQMEPHRPNLTNLNPFFLQKAHADMNLGNDFFFRHHIQFLSRQNWPFLAAFLTFPELRAGFPKLRAEREL